MSISGLFKPEYILKPKNIFNKLFFEKNRTKLPKRISKINNLIPINIDLNDEIGKSIFTYGIYDLSITELIAFIVKPGYAIDAMNYLKGIAQYANDATGTSQLKGVKNNCRYERDGLRVYIRSVLPIKAGDELLVFYGEEYWTEEGETTQESPVPKLQKINQAGKNKPKRQLKPIICQLQEKLL